MLRGMFSFSRWGVPSPLYNPDTGKFETGGLIWYGRMPATDKDMAAAYKKFGNAVSFDTLSLVGTANPSWTYYAKVKRPLYKRHVVL